MSETTFSSIALPAGFVATVLLTYVLMKIGLRQDILDIPNERSSHSAPVPRGGGLSVIIAFFAFVIIYQRDIHGLNSDSVWSSLLFGGAIIAVVGFIDDLRHLSARWRFLTHLFAAVLSLSLLPSLPVIMAFGFSLDLGAFGFVFFAFALVWFVNLFNFMDGIDGIAGIEAITVLGSAALILLLNGQLAWLTTLSYLAVCVAGFLVWNWSPAKVFMGDACSGFLGFTLGLLMIVTSAEGTLTVWVWAILCGVFLVDATTTLIRRMCRRERWYEAHRSHAYQILSRKYGSHQTVTVGTLVINVVWLLPLGLLATGYPYWGFLICCVALAPLLVLAFKVGAGTHEVVKSAPTT